MTIFAFFFRIRVTYLVTRNDSLNMYFGKELKKNMKTSKHKKMTNYLQLQIHINFAYTIA